MFSWIRQVVAWLVIIGVVVVLAAAVVVPRLAGATPYTVLTGSMRPDRPPGTLVVVRPVDPDDLAVGDVVTYQLESGEATVVTHRIVAIGNQLDGDLVLTTQGDANDVPDREPVKPVQVRGRLWYSIPYLGYVNNALSGKQRQVAVLVVSTGLVGYAAFMFVGAVRDRRRGRLAPASGDAAADTPDDIEITDNTDDITEPDAVPVARPEPHQQRGLRGPLLAAILVVAAVLLLLRRHTGRGRD
ncbi:signal peptidase I [Nocardioides kongjuensis]|uniref:Signal peptidase I n=1 Tax=Nocardioides kongjuensis TaxID=349522 RepID=A0A852RKX5_9ACTN|nr:signal peptidase I [Nocardioides kongjuensis]NYD29520.1 signal peptidase [Nocardioides kongjuensis]